MDGEKKIQCLKNELEVIKLFPVDLMGQSQIQKPADTAIPEMQPCLDILDLCPQPGIRKLRSKSYV